MSTDKRVAIEVRNLVVISHKEIISSYEQCIRHSLKIVNIYEGWTETLSVNGLKPQKLSLFVAEWMVVLQTACVSNIITIKASSIAKFTWITWVIFTTEKTLTKRVLTFVIWIVTNCYLHNLEFNLDWDDVVVWWGPSCADESFCKISLFYSFQDLYTLHGLIGVSLELHKEVKCTFLELSKS